MGSGWNYAKVRAQGQNRLGAGVVSQRSMGSGWKHAPKDQNSLRQLLVVPFAAVASQRSMESGWKHAPRVAKDQNSLRRNLMFLFQFAQAGVAWSNDLSRMLAGVGELVSEKRSSVLLKSCFINENLLQDGAENSVCYGFLVVISTGTELTQKQDSSVE